MTTQIKPYYERNEHVINSHINCNFEDLLDMTPDEFRDWVIEMRKVVKDAWDTYGCPPRTGKNEEEIVDAFNKIAEYPVHQFTHTDELSDVDDDIIINKSRMAVEVDQWFSNMFKTRINYTEKDNGYSIYDLVADDEKLDRVVKGAMRHLRRDSFYTHALSAIKHDKKYSIVDVSSGDEWVNVFFENPKIFKGYDFLLEQIKIREGVNSGYFQLEQDDVLQLTKEQVESWRDMMSYRHHSTFDINDMPDDKVYAIRIYKTGRKVFPAGFKSFRIGYIQPAVNFPPMTAKYLYERFTDDIKEQERIVIYDPSSGWGGRILGAIGSYSKYESLANFYNTKTYRGNPFFSETNTFEVFHEGSEVIHLNKDFQKYKNSLDLVFTSPPYFNREAYSEDDNQSYKKFNSYESWRHGFLRPTLETCVEYLKEERYLLWNIADLLVGGNYLPLEKDSKDILESLGMEYKYTLKMALEGMPGKNRIGEDGKPTCKNFCQVDGKYLKYEPVFVFWKPKQ